jgi:hypothetical protein
MKITAPTEAVSSPPEEKWHWTQKCRRNASCAGQKPVVDWKNDLQIEGAGRKSKKQPTPFVGIKPYGKCQITSLMLMLSCQNTSVSLRKTQAAARKAQAS